MNRQEFEQLRDLPNKQIAADIEWQEPQDMRPSLIFDRVKVKNSLGVRVEVNGRYTPASGRVTYNFIVVGTGPVCRVETNAEQHGDAGRSHKHDLHVESDPRNNLPVAAARPDLVDKWPREVWDDLCKRANIVHSGTFNDPTPDTPS